MPGACTVTIRGRTYPSIKAASRAAGRSEKTAHAHLNRYGHLDFLGLERRPYTRPDRRTPITVAGETFESMTAAAAALGVDRKTIRNARHRPAARDTLLRAVMQYRKEKGA